MSQSVHIDFPHKVLVPQPPVHLVSRPRLTALLNDITEQRLITLTAQAGYGKTSLLIDFAHTESSLPICWYTLDQFDQDPWVFLSYIAASIAQHFPVTHTATALTSQVRPPFEETAAALTRDVYAIDQDFVLIIDDWHLVDHVPEVRNLIGNLLLRCPRFRCIIASRVHPGIPNMMLLAARRAMAGIEDDLLRFTPAETASVLKSEYHTNVTVDRATALTEQTNGWITGVLLTIQAAGVTHLDSMQSSREAERWMYRFLAEQVFDQQPADLQTFLLDSALLEEITPERCDILFERGDSGSLLDQLLRRHLFISEIKFGVFRYHPMFREFLLEQYRKINRQQYRATAIRVAGAYAEQEQWAQAFDLCIAAGDTSAAKQVLLTGGQQLYAHGRLDTLERCFAALPLTILNATLLCLRARVLLDRGQHDKAQVLAELAEARMGPDEQVGVLLLKAHIARVMGHYEEAIEAGQQVLDRTQIAAQRALALHIMGICHQRLGQLDSTVEKLEQALAIERQRGNLYTVATIQQDIGVYYHEVGQLHRAEEYYSHADGYWVTIENIGRRALSLNSKGCVQHTTGRYREAHATFVQALQCARDAAATDYEALVLVSLGDLYSDMQLWERADMSYNAAKRLGGTAYVVSYLDVAIVRLLVRQRQYNIALHALQRVPETTLHRQNRAVQLLRCSIDYGLRNYEQAARDIEEIIGRLEQMNIPTELAQAYLLQAHILSTMQPDDDATLLAALERAVQIADRLGYDAFLVAETLYMRSMIRRAQEAGWKRATDWLQRAQDLLRIAQMLDQDDQRPMLVIQTLGTDQITLDGQPIEIGWLKAREVLYYLLAHSGGATSDTLREAIWPEQGSERSRSVKDAVYQLRSVLPRDLIELHARQYYRINRDVVHIDYDVERFLHLCESGSNNPEALLEAIDLYSGTYLAWSENEWSSSMRTHLEQRYLQTLRAAAAYCSEEGMYADALNLYRRILVIDDLDESAHAGVMRCQMLLGNRAAAIGQYQTLRRVLDEELGLDVERTSEVEQLYRRILNAT